MAHEDDPDLTDTEVVDEDDGGGPIKSFLDHLEDLRWTIIKSAAAIGVGMLICLVASPQIIEALRYPLKESGIKVNLETLGPAGGFMVTLKLGFYVGLVVALPFVLYFVGQFVVPALKKREKKYFYRIFFIGGGFFLIGVEICYLHLLPMSLKWLMSYNEWIRLPTEIWRAEEYFDFVTKFVLGVGLLCETPIVILSLVRLQVIPHATLIKGRRYMFVINFVFCAIITPADLVTTFIMAAILQVMFEGCIVISRYWERQRLKAEREL